ncbi:MAG: hypothetical protein HDS65_07795 [Bacteroidales bacterium]|nr:hypothetical protein [Bacteroidales bacterium]
MKKALLLAAAASMAFSATAEVFPKASEMDGEDISPAGYLFNSYDKEFIGYTYTEDILPWNMNANWYCKNYVQQGKTIGEGVILVTGGQVYNKEENIKVLEKASKIVDLGGTVGKVLCINFAGSEFPAKYEEITGKSLEIGEALPNGWPVLFWQFDHTLLMDYLHSTLDGEDYMPLRVRVELSIFANNQSSTGNYWKAYVMDDQGEVRPGKKKDNEAPDILVNPEEFAYRWCEVDESDPDDDSIYDAGANAGAGEWNPNRWLVYEWDINVGGSGEDGSDFTTNIRLKNEIPGGSLGGFSVLIRSLNLYIPENLHRDYIYKARPRTWNFYTAGDTGSNGVEGVTVAEDALSYTVNGSTVSFNTPAKVYTIAGAYAGEGTEVNLSKGIYVAHAAGKAVKFVVK